MATELTERLVFCKFLLSMMLQQKQLIVCETSLIWTIRNNTGQLLAWFKCVQFQEELRLKIP